MIEVKMQFDVSRTQSFFQALPRNVQKQIGNAMFKIAKNYQRNLRYSLRKHSKRFDNKIFNGIRARKISNNQSIVNMPVEGRYLDDMTPHFVSLKKGRIITKWAMARGYKGKVIFVRPHPFIVEGLNRGRENRQRILQQAMDLAVNNSRKA